MPGDITGSMVIDSRQAGELTFREGPVFTNLLLADEINRTPPKTQSALLEAMEEGQVSVDGVSRTLPAPFLVAATQNPVEYEGTYPLPEAQLDRFLLKVVLPIPERDRRSWRSCAGTPPASTRATCAAAGRHGGRRRRRHRGRAQAAVRTVQVTPEVAGYIVDIARATRRVAVAQPRRQPARRHRAAAGGPGLGLADRPRLRHARRRQGAGARDPRAPARAAPRGRARGRRRGRGARHRARLGAGPPLSVAMVITGRVPLLLLLGLVPVVLRPEARARSGCGCSWSRCWSLADWLLAPAGVEPRP